MAVYKLQFFTGNSKIQESAYCTQQSKKEQQLFSKVPGISIIHLLRNKEEQIQQATHFTRFFTVLLYKYLERLYRHLQYLHVEQLS